ncbi:MAG TPA: hypothetical protein VGL39_07595 [Jatrophihabitantaceae bacterium]|jgi:transposase-like protein
MATQPRSPSEHYAEAERLLAVAESAGTDRRIQQVAALAGVGHALLAAAPRRARRGKRAPDATRTPTNHPRYRWIVGDDQDGASS